ncbi:Coiled-coil domain-containing protein 18, putative isoform 2 [Quillaja saponaria]|uniref:Coiled-coil domain-containing protein 18, putative isoform 2 n=1 Tax=Quillaja saponaria TaxID=32244 RepID=A0AAD7PIN2_QUISA|nr:Coiled-coil domain-containing protein 18, putative isoform 2 [Quillaja saponaria]
MEASIVRIDRKSSIESEPRTLGFDKLQYAREVALYVMNTRSREEATNIFTEGLEPVISNTKHSGSDRMMELNDEDDDGRMELLENRAGELLEPRLRDVASAPFLISLELDVYTFC